MPKPVAEGDRIWGLRCANGEPEDWTQYALDAKLNGAEGGAGKVVKLRPRTNPQLVAKLYKPSILKRITTEESFARRIFAMARERLMLMQTLPFAVWPRRLLFTSQPSQDFADIRAKLIGFTMTELVGTVSLATVFSDERTRLRMQKSQTAHILITIADQLNRMHKHQWGFVFGDMSPSNIHITHDYAKVLFIDTDSFQFDYTEGTPFSFAITGLTTGYKSPGAIKLIRSRERLTAAHDDFVLAILIFMALMGDLGQPKNPFDCADFGEDALIEQRRFPYDDAANLPVPPPTLAAYKSLPQPIREAFTRSFTQPTPVTAAAWTTILSQYRRGLH